MPEKSKTQQNKYELAVLMFGEGQHGKVVARVLKINERTARDWEYDWKIENHPNRCRLNRYELKKLAFRYFAEGMGYRRVSATLVIPIWQAKGLKRAYDKSKTSRRKEIDYTPDDDDVSCLDNF